MWHQTAESSMSLNGKPTQIASKQLNLPQNGKVHVKQVHNAPQAMNLALKMAGISSIGKTQTQDDKMQRWRQSQSPSRDNYSFNREQSYRNCPMCPNNPNYRQFSQSKKLIRPLLGLRLPQYVAIRM